MIRQPDDRNTCAGYKQQNPMTTKINIKQIKGTFVGSALAGSMGTGQITDDIQMAMFTAEGLILSKVRSEYIKAAKINEPVYHSLLRWLYTQQTSLLGDMIKQYGSCSIVDGILMGHKELFELRDPSETSLKALDSGKMGTFEYPQNHSAGPGAIVRNIPLGIAFKDSKLAFQAGCDCAVITHGHPCGYLSAGFLSCLICEIINCSSCDNPLETAMDNSILVLKTYEGHEDILETIYQAKNLSMRMRPQTLSMQEHFPNRSALHALGAGLFFALTFGEDFKKGLQQATEQSNTSEASAITGGILGAIHGIDAIPESWFSNLELNDVILEISEDLFNHFHKDLA